MWVSQILFVFISWIEKVFIRPIYRTASPSKTDWSLIRLVLQLSNLSDLRLADIVQNLHTQGVEVLSIEPVINAKRWISFMEEINRLKRGSNNQGWVRWDIAFHGTPEENVPGIVEHGFQLPNKDGHKSRFHVNWGPGIYSSPYSTYALWYGNWIRNNVQIQQKDIVQIFVCAVNRGRRQYECRLENRCKHRELMDGFGSHVSPDGNEWVVFDERRIEPLCVMRVQKTGRQWFYSWENITLRSGCGVHNFYGQMVATAIEAASGEKARYQAFRTDVCTSEGLEDLIKGEDLVYRFNMDPDQQ
jgi:hypothetical protein